MIQTQQRDLKLLEDLQYDRKIQPQVGVVNFRYKKKKILFFDNHISY